MAEYIKRNAALKALRQVSAPTPDESYIVEKCIEKINRLPKMEVVRCKDCKYRYTPNSPTGKPFCTQYFEMPAKDDDFCSYGERREGNVE